MNDKEDNIALLLAVAAIFVWSTIFVFSLI